MSTTVRENGELCVKVGPVIKTVGILTWLLKALAVNGDSHLAELGCTLALIRFNTRLLKCLKGDDLPLNGPKSMQKSSSSSSIVKRVNVPPVRKRAELAQRSRAVRK